MKSRALAAARPNPVKEITISNFHRVYHSCVGKDA
jgi:hypothetical protein